MCMCDLVGVMCMCLAGCVRVLSYWWYMWHVHVSSLFPAGLGVECARCAAMLCGCFGVFLLNCEPDYGLSTTWNRFRLL